MVRHDGIRCPGTRWKHRREVSELSGQRGGSHGNRYPVNLQERRPERGSELRNDSGKGYRHRFAPDQRVREAGSQLCQSEHSWSWRWLGWGSRHRLIRYGGHSSMSAQQYNGRVDWDVTSKDRLSYIMYYVPLSTSSLNGGARAYNKFYHDQVNESFAGIWNHTFSPTLLNEARVNAAGWRWNEVNSNPQSPVGLPTDSIGNLGSIGAPNSFGPNVGSHLNQWTYSAKDVAT